MEFPQIGIAVAVTKGTNILLGKRLKEYGYGKYQLPGGHLEMYDTFEDRAKIEVKEETGLEVDRLQLLEVYNSPSKEHNKHYVVLFYGAAWISGEPHVPENEKDKVEFWNWYDITDYRSDNGHIIRHDLLPKPLFELNNVIIKKIRSYAFEQINFDYNVNLNKIAAWLREKTSYNKEIKPHSSTRGTYWVHFESDTYYSKIPSFIEQLERLEAKKVEIGPRDYLLNTPFGECYVRLENTNWEGGW